LRGAEERRRAARLYEQVFRLSGTVVFIVEVLP
jgi:hypothetical protein